jgi:hypothetical protein
MFDRHVLKVIIGFCGMILLGLISLVIIDSLQPKQEATNSVNQPKTSTLPPVKVVCCNSGTTQSQNSRY